MAECIWLCVFLISPTEAIFFIQSRNSIDGELDVQYISSFPYIVPGRTLLSGMGTPR